MTDSDSEVEITCGEAASKKWATMKKLSPKTPDRLIELGYDSIMEALSLLAEDDLGEAIIKKGLDAASKIESKTKLFTFELYMYTYYVT